MGFVVTGPIASAAVIADRHSRSIRPPAGQLVAAAERHLRLAHHRGRLRLPSRFVRPCERQHCLLQKRLLGPSWLPGLARQTCHHLGLVGAGEGELASGEV